MAATAERPAVAARRGQAKKRGRGGALGRWLGTPRAELLLVAGLFLFALATRWPYLLRLPHFTDETVEVFFAMEIWRGEKLPLHGWGYYGPLHAYITAVCLWLFGPSIVLPRAIVLVFGALTVLATYLLGRELAGRPAALLGAALLASAPQHIIVNSHVAWFNSTTPFYTTLSCWALVRAIRLFERERAAPASRPRWWARGGPSLALAGFLFGLALHTHPGTIVLAPALAAAALVALWRRRLWGLLRGPWPYLAPLAGIVAYSPVLWFNLTNGLYGVERVQTSRRYAYEMEPSWDSYLHNLRNLVFQLGRMISNPMRIPERPLHYLTSPYLTSAAALCLAGIVLLLRRRQPLPLFALLSTLAIMPRFNTAYGVEGDRYMLTGRYVTYLLPLAYLAIALAALTLAGLALRAVPRAWRGLALRAPARAVPAALLALLVLYPLLPLGRYYRHESAKDPGNATFLATVRFLDEARGPDTPILLDDFLHKVDLKDGADAREILSYLLTLDGVPHQSVPDPRTELLRRGAAGGQADAEALPLVVMMRDRCWPLRDELPLVRVSERFRLRELYWDLPSYYAVYRLTPGAPLPACFAPTGPQEGD
jgi:4-amino-4-deoxy-L-arabinose transferase-like glycosyltransferase